MMQYRLSEFFRGGSLLSPTSVLCQKIYLNLESQKVEKVLHHTFITLAIPFADVLQFVNMYRKEQKEYLGKIAVFVLIYPH